MTTVQAPGYAVGEELRPAEARSHFKDLLDNAEAGRVQVIRRGRPVAVIDRATLGALLLAAGPVPVLSSIAGGQFAFWVDGAPVHAVGDSLGEAEDEFLDALIDYSQEWFDVLHAAPNHQEHRRLALLVRIYAGDRAELHEAIFGDDS